MSAPMRGQISRQSRKCTTKNIFGGLLSVMIIGIVAMCQVLYNRKTMEITMEPKPQVQAIIGAIKTPRSQPSSLHITKMTVPDKRQPSKLSTRKPLTKKSKKNTLNKKTKHKGITSNIIIEGEVHHAMSNKMRKNATAAAAMAKSTTDKKNPVLLHAGKVSEIVLKTTIKTNRKPIKKLRKNIRLVSPEIHSSKVRKLGVKQNRKPSASTNHQKCPNILRLMSVGKWTKKKSSKAEIDFTETFLADARKQLRIHDSLSRPDGRCGNIGLPGLPHVRALCNPKGDKPCCYENTCKALSVEQCRCKNCYDVRQRVHAEHATWTPRDSRCKFKNFTAQEACDLLPSAQVYLVGDSLMRDLYIAFLMVVKNDGRFGALKASLSEEYRSKCEGPYSFGSKECLSALETNPGTLCKGTFKLTYISHSNNTWASFLSQVVNRTLGKDKSLVMFGQGVQEKLNSTRTKQCLEKSIHLLKTKEANWPKLVWASTHAPGLLNAPLPARQEFHQVDTFNKEMVQYLTPLGIPAFDTFKMTAEAVSIDGSHYGMGVNLAKVQLFLNYLQYLRDRRQW